MGFKRFLKKGGLLGLGVPGHLIDAYKKQKETGKSYTDCLEDSVKETVCEDLPITSHLYSVGKKMVASKVQRSKQNVMKRRLKL